MRIWPLLLIAIIAASGCTGYATKTKDCASAIAGLPKIIAENSGESQRLFAISKVVDGDTIELANKQKVRFLGINTPEKGLKWSAEAAALTENLTKRGAYLQKDVEDEDKYNRWLRYVFTNESFVNAELLRQGLATIFPVEPNNKYTFLLSCLEQEAKANKRGIWSSAANYSIKLEVNYDAEGKDNENLNGEFVTITNTGPDRINMQNWSIKDQATHFYYFKNTNLAPQQNIILYTGTGSDTKEKIYWNSKDPIWNNDGDTAYLMDENGDLVIEKSWSQS